VRPYAIGFQALEKRVRPYAIGFQALEKRVRPYAIGFQTSEERCGARRSRRDPPDLTSSNPRKNAPAPPRPEGSGSKERIEGQPINFSATDQADLRRSRTWLSLLQRQRSGISIVKRSAIRGIALPSVGQESFLTKRKSELTQETGVF